MKRTLLAAALLSGVSAPAFAVELTCDAPRYVIGEDTPGSDQIRSISVNYHTGNWEIVYTFVSGYLINRANQYAITDMPGTSPTWEGWHLKRPNLKMDGAITWNGGNAYTYREEITNVSKNKITLDWTANCRTINFAGSPTPPPTYNPPPSDGGGSGSSADVVPITMRGHAIHVMVTLGGTPVDMVLDTGAGLTSITTTLADDLIASGRARELEPRRFYMANGSSEVERVISVNSLTIGSHTRTHVLMSVSSDDGMMLLGLPVLNAIGRFTIDAGNNQLIFG